MPDWRSFWQSYNNWFCRRGRAKGGPRKLDTIYTPKVPTFWFYRGETAFAIPSSGRCSFSTEPIMVWPATNENSTGTSCFPRTTTDVHKRARNLLIKIFVTAFCIVRRWRKTDLLEKRKRIVNKRHSIEIFKLMQRKFGLEARSPRHPRVANYLFPSVSEGRRTFRKCNDDCE